MQPPLQRFSIRELLTMFYAGLIPELVGYYVFSGQIVPDIQTLGFMALVAIPTGYTLNALSYAVIEPSFKCMERIYIRKFNEESVYREKIKPERRVISFISIIHYNSENKIYTILHTNGLFVFLRTVSISIFVLMFCYIAIYNFYVESIFIYVGFIGLISMFLSFVAHNFYITRLLMWAYYRLANDDEEVRKTLSAFGYLEDASIDTASKQDTDAPDDCFCRFLDCLCGRIRRLLRQLRGLISRLFPCRRSST